MIAGGASGDTIAEEHVGAPEEQNLERHAAPDVPIDARSDAEDPESDFYEVSDAEYEKLMAAGLLQTIPENQPGDPDALVCEISEEDFEALVQVGSLQSWQVEDPSDLATASYAYANVAAPAAVEWASGYAAGLDPS